MITRRMNLLMALCVVVLTVGYTAVSQAAAADAVTGTWKWAAPAGRGGRGGGGGGAAPDPNAPPPAPRMVTLELKLDGDKVTGTIIQPAGGRRGGGGGGGGAGGPATQPTPVAIQDGAFKDGKLTFKVTRSFGGNEIVISYEATITGDVMKGKSTQDRNGEPVTTEFEGKRQAM